MKINNIVIVFFIALFSFVNVTYLPASNIDALVKEANKVVAGKYPITKKKVKKRSLSLGYFGQRGMGFQFTVSRDQEPGIPGAKKFDYKGKEAFFFRPLGDSSGAIMVLLTPKKSLVLLYNLGMFSDNEVTKQMMIDFLDKMDLSVIK